MLTNAEYANQNRLPVNLSDEVSEFAMFSLEMSEAKHCVGRDANGKRIVKKIFPKIDNKDSALWNLNPVRSELTLAEIRKQEADDSRRSADMIRAANVAKYAAMVAADPRLQGEVEIDENDNFDGLFPVVEEKIDEDEAFFALDVELVGGKCRRRGGVKNHSAFESLVDG